MVLLNKNFNKLAAGYLFPEIGRRKKEFEKNNLGVELISLGIGNTTEPLTPTVALAIKEKADELANVNTYSGYGNEGGEEEVREALINHYKTRGVSLTLPEIFISCGAKEDSSNIQSIFGRGNHVAVQDPAYPVYVDTNVIAGRTGEFDKEKEQYRGLIYMACTEENGFVPDVPSQPANPMDIIYLCSPNNPTGAVMKHSDLEKFVKIAKKRNSIIIFDAAYSAFIKDESLPKSIYEVEGAKDCAIEINSLSKSHGFTGVRMGWTVVPETLKDGRINNGKINKLWRVRQGRHSNEASNLAQAAGLAALSEQGMIEGQGLVDYYMENARIIKEGVGSVGLKAYGGDNAPYIWMKTPGNMDSWDFFDKMLNETHVVGTPGSGFGPSGQGYFRLSAFGHRKDIGKAVESIKQNLVL